MRLDTLLVEPFRDMLMTVLEFIPTLLISLGILFIGCLIAHSIERFINHFLKSIDIDKFADKVGVGKILKTGGVKRKTSSLIGYLTYWVLMVIFLILSVKALGMPRASELLDKVLAYIPNVIAGVVVLVFGMLLAKFVAGIIYIAAKNTDMPVPGTLAKLSRWAIVVYVAIVFLKEIGFMGLFVGHYSIFIAGIVFAIALSFGLAGKDVASHYLGVLDKEHK